jgi:putative membrane protein
MKTVRRVTALPAVLVLGTLLLLSSAGPASASGRSHWVSVGQIVLVGTNTAGQVSGTPFVFTQLAANGSGPVTVKVPMPASGFRNLSGLRPPPITDGKAVWNLQLSGQHTERTVAHFPAALLPLQVSATYEFNGKKTKPQDILGQTGHLKVTYSIKNITTKATTVAFKNVFGEKETRTVQAPVPMAAAFAVTFPATFTNLKAPGGSLTGNGNGTTGGAWTLFLFNPLGGVHQSVSYEAQVTDAAIPSASLSAQALPPGSLKPLPTIGEPQAPAVPVVTIGGRLAALQVALQKRVHEIAVKASIVLGKLKQVLVPAELHVASRTAKLAARLTALSAAALNLSATVVPDISARLARHTAEAAAIAAALANVKAKVTALPAAICGALSHIPVPTATSPSPSASLSPSPIGCESRVTSTRAYRFLLAKAVALEDLARRHLSALAATGQRAKKLQALALTLSANLAAGSASANALSARAALAAATLENAVILPGKHKNRKTIHPKQLGGGAKVDAAVGQLDAAISSAGTKVDNSYAYLTALDTRAGQSQLPAGNASGATVQTQAFVYSLPAVNYNAQHTHYATVVGVTAMALGSTIGLALYRRRRGLGSSLFPAKAKG